MPARLLFCAREGNILQKVRPGEYFFTVSVVHSIPIVMNRWCARVNEYGELAIAVHSGILYIIKAIVAVEGGVEPRKRVKAFLQSLSG